MGNHTIDVYYTVNSGIYLWNGTHGLMIDYLFDGGIGWSGMSEDCVERMRRDLGEFRHPHSLLFSHRHGDHFSAELARAHQEFYPAADCLIPDMHEAKPVQYEAGGWTVLFFPAAHQGRENRREEAVYVICAHAEGQWFIHCSDAVLDEALCERMRAEGVGSPAAAFVNLYHLAEPGILQKMKPGHMFCIHLPLEKDDIFGFRHQCEQLMQKNRDRLPGNISMAQPFSRLLPAH